MPKILTKQQVEQFHELGYVSPVDVVSEDEASLVREKLEAVERNHPDQISAEQRNNAHLSFKFLDELVHHPIILDAVEDLVGPNISLWGSVLFIKDPMTSGYVSWHQDATYMGIEPHEFVTPWLALTPSNRENGCMSMIPGSHLAHIRPHEDTFDDDNILTRGQEVQGVDTSSAVDLILRAGQMSLHHAKIIHGSQPNRSQRRRIGYAMQAYMSSQARQVIGENYWLPIRGEQPPNDTIFLHRPRYDMDPDGIRAREKVNENWSNILYHGAKQKRAY